MTMSDVGSMPTVMDSSTVMCRNMMPGPTVIAADAKRNYEIVFAGKDDPNGEDVQAIPELLLHTIQFTNAIRKGVLSVEEGADHPVIQKAMSRQTAAFQQRMASENLSAREVLEAPGDNDLTVVNCIGPGTRDGAVCGDQVTFKEKEAAQRPPLCDRHAHLADFCVKRGSKPWVLEAEGLL